jgi:beta-lactamase superfamily II metal-dependent hydrolase
MAEHIRVRMYNVGFGDCFLVEFPFRDGEVFRVLVDCGAHTAGYPRQGWRPADVVDAIVADLADGAEHPTINVVIATHRHQDHVSGFAAPAWQGVNVDEVWMPWTEDPDDPEATAIRERQSRLALGLDNAFRQPEFGRRWRVDESLALQALAANSLTNENAMRTLHRGFRGRPRRRFLSSESAAGASTGFGELTVHVLGPSRDPEIIRDMDPPAGQSYLRFHPADAVDPDSADRNRSRGPFTRNFTLDPVEYESTHAGPVAEQDIKDAAAEMMRADDFATAVSLDKAVNGTSLMLMFEFRDAFLLFPGDAQWGTWNAALSRPQTRELLANTTFYKVGHHGSHNATPVEFLERTLHPERRMWAAATSVRPIGFWPDIPRGPLLTALDAHAERVIRADRPGGGADGVTVRQDSLGVDFHVPC